jgi:lipoate-protein ligase B
LEKDPAARIASAEQVVQTLQKIEQELVRKKASTEDTSVLPSPSGRGAGGEGGSRRGADYIRYIRDLEKTLILALANLGLGAGQMKGLTGVWIQADVFSRCPRCKPEDRQKPAKIAAIGVKVDARGVTRHGFALNVSPDMTYFDGIVPCGLPGHPVVSMQDLLAPLPSLDEVKQKVAAAFGEVFGCEVLSLELEQSRG